MNYSSLVSCVFVFTYMHSFYAILLTNKYVFNANILENSN